MLSSRYAFFRCAVNSCASGVLPERMNHLTSFYLTMYDSPQLIENIASSASPTMGRTPLQSAAESLLADIAAQKAPNVLLSHFSSTHNVTLQHDYIHNTVTYSFAGLHAVRSYFDLLSLHWMRDDMRFHDCHVYADKSQVVVKASVQWTWRVSKRSWRENFTCTLDFDERLKVKRFIVVSNPPEESCVMLAIDAAPIVPIKSIQGHSPLP